MIYKKIIGKRIYLRTLYLKDATQKYCNWLNDPIVNKYLDTHQATLLDLRKYIKKLMDDSNSIFVGIFDKKTNEHVGNMKLEPIDWHKKSAVFGMLIGNKAYWGKGIGTEAAKLLINNVFDETEISKITLGVYSENKPAIRVYEKVGFNVIEIKRNTKQHNCRFSNTIMMSINKK